MEEYLSILFANGTLITLDIESNSTAGTPWLKNIYRNGTADWASINAFWDGLTNSITNVIRTRGDTPPSGYALGTTLGNQTCIRVQWAWLSLPATLLLLTIVLLSATIVQTRSSGHSMAWKSSSLALLFHGLGQDGEERKYEALRETDEMEDVAKNLRVRLSPQGLGWRFVAE